MQKEHLIKLASVLIVIFLLFGGRVLFLQISHFRAAEGYYDNSEWKLAIREYDHALHMYTPLSPYIRKSAARLWQIGELFEKQGEYEWANMAYSSIRSSFYSSRSLYTPGKEWIAKCDEKISEINVKLLMLENLLKPEESQLEYERLLSSMRADRAPDPTWSVLIMAGFLGWAGSVFYLIMEGLNAKGGFIKKRAVYAFFGFVMSFALWVISLLNA